MVKPLRNVKQLMSLMIILSMCLVAMSFLPSVSALMSMALTPVAGPVGTVVQVTANVTTNNGNYTISYGSLIVANGTAVGISVLTNFTVPHSTLGSHTVVIIDGDTGDNATFPFVVTTDYSVNAVAAEKNFQEGDQIPLLINMSGGDASKSYAANVTVEAPNSAFYMKTFGFPISTSGDGNTTVNYPRDFTSDANSKLVGSYMVFFNGTLANCTFSVWLTNSSQYHRSDVVNIQAAYLPNEIATITILGTNINSVANASDPSGFISYNWTVPSYILIGSYSVTVISPEGPTSKTPEDTQNFTIPGFGVNVTTKNLAGDVVPSVEVKAYENSTLSADQTTDSNGLAQLTLEIGNFTAKAFFSNVDVGELNVTVTNATAFDFSCNLTDIRVNVVAILNGSELNIPEVGILLSSNNQTYTTNVSGSVIMQSLLPNATYVLNATRYSNSFNVTTLPVLLVDNESVAYYDVKIICPDVTLQVVATGANGDPISNAVVKIKESLGVPSLEGTTDASGTASFSAPFGSYDVQIYSSNNLKLNETTVNLFGQTLDNQTVWNQTLNVTCSLYGLDVTVKVVDYFGQGIANMGVTLQRQGLPEATVNTDAGGTATFNSVVGGQLNVIVSNGGSAPVSAQSVDVENSMTVQISVGQYTVLAGMLVQTSYLAAVIVVILIVVLVLGLELYRRRRVKTEKTETDSADKES
jgi:hypothetical protein